MGYDLSLTRVGVEPTGRVLDLCRRIPGFTIIHTREGHKTTPLAFSSAPSHHPYARGP